VICSNVRYTPRRATSFAPTTTAVADRMISARTITELWYLRGEIRQLETYRGELREASHLRWRAPLLHA